VGKNLLNLFFVTKLSQDKYYLINMSIYYTLYFSSNESYVNKYRITCATLLSSYFPYSIC